MPDIIRFAVATAMRLGQIINLKWKDLNEADRTIIIRDRKHPTEKSGNDQEVPLLGKAFDIVKRQPLAEERIFPVTQGTVSTIFPRACNALGIADLKFHDLRHEGVSRLLNRNTQLNKSRLYRGTATGRCSPGGADVIVDAGIYCRALLGRQCAQAARQHRAESGAFIGLPRPSAMSSTRDA